MCIGSSAKRCVERGRKLAACIIEVCKEFLVIARSELMVVVVSSTACPQTERNDILQHPWKVIPYTPRLSASLTESPTDRDQSVVL